MSLVAVWIYARACYATYRRSIEGYEYRRDLDPPQGTKIVRFTALVP